MEKLKSIHDSIDLENGRSKYFSTNVLEKASNEVDYVFLLFLPNFLLRTPFHYLILNENFELFNQIAQKLEKNGNLFDEFLESSVTVDKIIEMFIYILESVTSYPKSALKNIYCNLPVYVSDSDNSESDFDSSSDNSEKKVSKIFLENVQMIEGLLNKVRQKVKLNERYSNHSGFNFERWFD